MRDGRENLFSFSVNLLSLTHSYTKAQTSTNCGGRALFHKSLNNAVKLHMWLPLYSLYFLPSQSCIQIFTCDIHIEKLLKKTDLMHHTAFLYNNIICYSLKSLQFNFFSTQQKKSSKKMKRGFQPRKKVHQ